MTFIIDTGKLGRPSRETWRGSLVTPQERSFQPAAPAGYFTPAGERYRSLTESERDALIAELIAALSTCNPETQARMVNSFTAVDPDYGRRVADGLNLAPGAGVEA